MAYKGYKGCGPNKLGASPLKQGVIRERNPRQQTSPDRVERAGGVIRGRVDNRYNPDGSVKEPKKSTERIGGGVVKEKSKKAVPSPMKQTDHQRIAEIKQTRENLAKKGETIETRKKESMVRNLKEDLGNVGSNQMQGSSGIFGMLGGPIGKGVTAIASKLFGSSKNKKALDAFLKASPKDPTKTTRLSHYNKATPKKSEYFYNKSN